MAKKLTQVNLHLDADTIRLLDALRDAQQFKPARQTIARAIFIEAVEEMARKAGIKLPKAPAAEPVKAPKKLTEKAAAEKVAAGERAKKAAAKNPRSETAKAIGANVAKLAKPAKAPKAAKAIGKSPVTEASPNVDTSAA